MTWLNDARGNIIRADLVAIVFIAEQVKDDKTVYGVIGQLTVPGVQVVFSEHPHEEWAKNARAQIQATIDGACCKKGWLARLFS